NTNFEGRFTPRATALIKLTENNNIRLSYQTAYRFPSTQQQWINLDVGGNVRLIGGVQELKDYYEFDTNPVYTLGGQPITLDKLKPETVQSYEAGYRGLFANGNLLFDVYGYYGTYTDFIIRTLVMQSKTG